MKKLILIGLIANAFITSTVLAGDIAAQVNWSQHIDMSTNVSGIVDEVLVNPGDQVAQGDVLLRLEPARFIAALKSSEADKKNAKYKLKEAEREWERAQELYERTVLSDRDLQLVENALVAAQAAFAHASAEKINAKRDVIESSIRAPFAAVVLARHAEPGQVVVTRLQAVPLITIASKDNYHASGSVSATVANKLVIGQAAAVTVNDKRFNGTLGSVGYEPVSGTDTYPVTVRFSTGGGILRAGQAATIHLP